ncbi:MAG: serine protease [Lachnospiraceae bacterium]|nr:serine protease [Lachnospiraceae bacterium]MBQ2407585.1 serine protease [Lachnospiraceae bacterium]MEE0918424.1 S1C family serine protease [Lachnospiraceae bacterium]
MSEKKSVDEQEKSLNSGTNQQLDNSSDFEFLKEKIKERPVNKKKLLQRTIITASMALVFGGVACLTFLLMEPVLNNWMYPEEKPKEVTFPQEKQEMLPEDMLTEGNTTNIDLSEENETIVEADSEQATEIMQNPQTDVQNSTDNNKDTQNIDGNAQQQETSPLTDYRSQYEELYKIYKDIEPGMVTVTSLSSDTNWFNEELQSEGIEAGVIIANNNRELLILTRKSNIDKAETISVTFCDGVSVDAVIKKYDVSIDLAVIAVDLKYVGGSTLDNVTVAKLGSSSLSGITGTPVIAVGNIFGYNDSVCYGIVTSKGNPIYLSDSEYNLITTDIYSCERPSGILVDLNGEVIGIIDNRFNNADTKNLMSAIGITELKALITKMSNGEDIPYLGIQAQNISSQVRKRLELPQGAYIYDIDMDSPAMINGLQKGDIIVKVGAKEVKSASDYMNALREASFEKELGITVMRASVDEYKEMKFNILPIVRTIK